MFSTRHALLLTLLFAAAGVAQADAGHGHGTGIGSAADAEDASRTIEIEMTDNRYDHGRIDVGQGEVVRFVIHNKGQLVHEFNIGTPGMHEAHQDEMLAMMESGHMTPMKMTHSHGTKKHDDPNFVLLNPGETGELVWRFDRAIENLQFACNVPGHYQAGMVGELRVGAN